MSSPFKLIAVLIAAGFCVPAAFAADAVTSASVVPAAQKTQDGAVLEGTKTLAAKGGDRLPVCFGRSGSVSPNGLEAERLHGR